MVKPCASQTIQALDPELVTHAGGCQKLCADSRVLAGQELQLEPYHNIPCLLSDEFQGSRHSRN